MKKKLLALGDLDDLNGLLKGKQIPGDKYELGPDFVYLFYYSGKLHGYYQLSWKRGNMLFLKKYRGKPVYFHRPGGLMEEFGEAETCKAFSFFRSENRRSREANLRILQTGHGQEPSYRVEWTSTESGQLGGSHEVRLTEELREAGESLRRLPAGGLPLGRLKDAGERLYQAFFPESLRAVLERHDRIRYLSEGLWPFSFFRNGSFWGTSKILFAHKPFRTIQKKGSREISLLLSEADSDGPMKKEYDKLGSMLVHSRRPVNFLEGRFDFGHFSLTLEKSWGLHFIGHGRSAGEVPGLLMGNGKLFGVEELRRVKRVPVFLFLSACRGGAEREEWEKLFFEKGGRTLIRHHGEMASEGMVPLAVSFYWQWMNLRTTVGRALLGARRKCLGEDPNWAMLELVGDPDLRM